MPLLRYMTEAAHPPLAEKKPSSAQLLATVKSLRSTIHTSD